VLVKLVMPFYIALFAIMASSARIDAISVRFVLPMTPFLAIGLAAFFLRPTTGRLKRSLKTVTWLLFLSLTGTRLVLALLNGLDMPDGLLSPETITYVKTNIPSDSVIAVSRYGKQINAFEAERKIVRIPVDNEYSSAYGHKIWTRHDATKVFLDENVRYVVFFMGENRVEPFLHNGKYGPYIKGLFEGTSCQVRTRTSLRDGEVIELKPLEVFSSQAPTTCGPDVAK